MRRILAFVLATLFTAPVVTVAHCQSYKVTNLISDGSVPAAVTDPNFINPWAVSPSPNWWISAQGTGFNYVVAPAGSILFKVIVPTAAAPNTAPGLPAGSVTTAGTVGMILPNGTKAAFIFSTLDGTISGWNSKLGMNNALSEVVINNSATGASYPSLAVLNTATSSYLLAANFGVGNSVEVYDSSFKATKLTGSFTDPKLPAGYSPFSVHVLGSQIFVAYALRSSGAPYRTLSGAGNGIVDVYDITGNFISRVATGGNLNAPWGIAFAPANFGIFSNDLLVGNFGDGTINVYDPKTFSYLGQMMDSNGKPMTYANLWELLPGGTPVTNSTAVGAGDLSTVYFTAGLTNEAHGLFAAVSNGPSTGATPTFGFSASMSAASVNAGNSAQASVSVVPTNGFSGTVNLTCSGLPVGATCTFTPAQLSVSPSAPAIGSVVIQTSKSYARLQPLHLSGANAMGVSATLLLPFVSLVALRRRLYGTRVRSSRLLGLLLVSTVASCFVVGCADGAASSSRSTPATPAGTSNIVITAVAGAISQSATVALTVQ